MGEEFSSPIFLRLISGKLRRMLAFVLAKAKSRSTFAEPTRNRRSGKVENGGLAQLARALAWHARGHRFDSDILHSRSNQKATLRLAQGRLFCFCNLLAYQKQGRGQEPEVLL
jgi:hypothetical protein